MFSSDNSQKRSGCDYATLESYAIDYPTLNDISSEVITAIHPVFTDLRQCDSGGASGCHCVQRKDNVRVSGEDIKTGLSAVGEFKRVLPWPKRLDGYYQV